MTWNTTWHQNAEQKEITGAALGNLERTVVKSSVVTTENRSRAWGDEYLR